jgi:nucleoside-diphosphate-sugar epimerase
VPILVTGATGFIGSRLVSRLRDQGREVRCLVRSLHNTDHLRACGADPRIASLDDGPGLDDVVRGCKTVVHLAGVIRAWSRNDYFRVNAEGTRQLLGSASRTGVERLVLVSSLAAAGPSVGDVMLTEEDRPRPITAYGESKLSAEGVLADCWDKKLEWSVVRPCAVYGPGDQDFYQLFRLCKHRLVPFVAAPLALLSLVHVDDVVELLLLCMEKAPRGAVYFCSSGAAHGWVDVIRTISDVLGSPSRAMRLPPSLLWPAALLTECLRPFMNRPPVLSRDKLREAREESWLCSPGKAMRELGFVPRHALRSGIEHTLDWYRAAGWL